MLVPRPTGSHVAGAAPKRRAPDALSLNLRAGISPQQRNLDLQEIQSWFQSGSVQGGLWLPDRAYLAQDSAGTAVTAVGQVVGTWRDASQWESVVRTIRADLSDINKWTVYGSNTVAIDDGAVKITYVGGTNSGYGAYAALTTAGILPGNLTVGRLYKASIECRVNTGGNTSPQITQLDNITWGAATSDAYQELVCYFICTTAVAASFRLANNLSAGESFWVKSITLHELAGNHGTQTTTPNKPLSAITPQTQLPWLNADATDAVPVVFPSALGSACTIARATPTGVEFADSRTVNATWNDLVRPNQYNSAVCVLNRPLSAYEKAVVSRVLGRYVPVLKSEFLANGEFQANLNGWYTGNGAWTWSNGTALKTGSQPTASAALVAASTLQTAGKTFFISVNILAASTNFNLFLPTSGTTLYSSTSLGIKSFTFAFSSNSDLSMYMDGTGTGQVESISFREVV